MKKMSKKNYQSQPDKDGHFDLYGGTYVSETLIYPLKELLKAYKKIAKSYTLAGTKTPERFKGESAIYKTMEEPPMGKSYKTEQPLGDTFAKAYYAEDQIAWFDGHVSAFEYFGGVPEVKQKKKKSSVFSSPFGRIQ